MAPNNTTYAVRRALLNSNPTITLTADATDHGVTLPRAQAAYFCYAITTALRTQPGLIRFRVPDATREALGTLVRYMTDACSMDPMPRFTKDGLSQHRGNDFSLAELIATACGLKMDLDFIGLKGQMEARLELRLAFEIVETWPVARRLNCAYLEACTEKALARAVTQCGHSDELDAYEAASALNPTNDDAFDNRPQNIIARSLTWQAHNTSPDAATVESMLTICGMTHFTRVAINRLAAQLGPSQLTHEEAMSIGITETFCDRLNRRIYAQQH